MMYDQTRAQQPSGKAPGRDERRAPGPDALFPASDRDKILQRLGQAVNIFADTPREALEKAEGAFDEAAALLVEALAEQRRLLREGWQDQDPETQSTELRLALRQYREVTQRMLRL
ncbi:putative RNase H-like HicB family nuclease [Streptomyces sp. LBL]|uniref:hypothetical protein n=1 Tax=Streptomyces sp. LBL TaxID=2940562 RepID=UPI002477020D|nr:hypothetical protein [Streptomyces sp. LBL]MDH6624267.1 putative RNase H-like HicB family nuclease [Streptomyces sp. LBL]